MDKERNEENEEDCSEFDMITVEITITIRCWDDDDDLRITEQKNTQKENYLLRCFKIR